MSARLEYLRGMALCRLGIHRWRHLRLRLGFSPEHGTSVVWCTRCGVRR